MAENETSGGLSLEALLAAARSAAPAEAATEPAQPQPEAPAATAAPAEQGGPASSSIAPAAQSAAVPEAGAQPSASDEPEPAQAPADLLTTSNGFDLAAALGYGPDGSEPPRRSEDSYRGSAVATGSFDLAAALGYAPSASASEPVSAEEPRPARSRGVSSTVIAEAVVREKQAQAAADEVVREAIARAAREESTPRFRSRYADLPHSSTQAKDEPARGERVAARQAQDAQPEQRADAAPSAQGQSEPLGAAGVADVAAEQADVAAVEGTREHRTAVSRMASASARAAEAAAEARKAASSLDSQGEAEQPPVTFKSLQEAAELQAGQGSAESGASAPADEEVEVSLGPTTLEEELASQKPAFISVQEATEREEQRRAEEAAAAEEAARLKAEKEAQKEAARIAAVQKAAADRMQAEVVARTQASDSQVAPVASAPAAGGGAPGRPRKASVTATEEVMIEPLPVQQFGTISYEDAVFADEARQLETAAERKAVKKARRYRRLGTLLIIVALLCAVGAVALFLSATADATENIEAKAAEISETAGRTITYRYRAADANGTLCPTTEVATFSTGGALEQSVITMQTADFETAGHTLAYFKKQFQDSSYVDGRVDESSVVFTLHLSSEHLMKSTYTALVMSNTVGCEVII